MLSSLSSGPCQGYPPVSGQSAVTGSATIPYPGSLGPGTSSVGTSSHGGLAPPPAGWHGNRQHVQQQHDPAPPPVPATASYATGGVAPATFFECRLESAHDLAALLATLQLREKEQKDQRIQCEASGYGLKFTAQSGAKDTTVVAWMFRECFKEYGYIGQKGELLLKFPVAEVMSCLQVFSDRAAMVLRYPAGPAMQQLRFRLEEDGNVTECRVHTLVVGEEALHPHTLFTPQERLSMFSPLQPETWHTALNEFVELDAADVHLSITLHASPTETSKIGSVVLRVQTLVNDAEVELPARCLDDSVLSPEAAARGGVTHRYLLSSVLAACLRAAKDAKAVKVRFNVHGAMSNMFIHRGRGGQRDLYVEALVSPLAQVPGLGAGSTSLGGP